MTDPIQGLLPHVLTNDDAAVLWKAGTIRLLGDEINRLRALAGEPLLIVRKPAKE